MDILNFISWIKGGRVVTTVDPAKTLLPVGLKDNKRDDGYLAGAISVEDFAAQLVPPIPEPTYKVFTALLTQSGGDNNRDISQGDNITLGVTYYISINSENADLTFFGAPNNDVGTYFVCTQSGLLPSIGSISLLWNEGAPVATVLENTIGNIWFTYNNVGFYQANSNGLFTNKKTIISLLPEMYTESPSDLYNYQGSAGSQEILYLLSYYNNELFDNQFGIFSQNAIEIRVYN